MPDAFTPLTITPRNCELALGVKWRWLCELAGRHGIEVWRVGGKRLLPAGPIVEAMRREAAEAAKREPTEGELVERMRAALGMELRAR